jgi:hypothetical protein
MKLNNIITLHKFGWNWVSLGMMEAVRTSETPSIPRKLHCTTSQQALILVFVKLG